VDQAPEGISDGPPCAFADWQDMGAFHFCLRIGFTFSAGLRICSRIASNRMRMSVCDAGM
jgi:hypothetical protein